ncbi:MAG: ABC transporter permease [Betaproteobacteria bacterium]|nr:MAG: ABC transporter permease [Betaproteobacteria bacterium]
MKIAIDEQNRLVASARRSGRLPVIPVAILVLLLIDVIFAGVIAPHSPYATDLSKRLIPPAWLPGGDVSYLLGTDLVGRDLLSRLMTGARASLGVALATIFVGGTVGIVLGMVAGYAGGRTDSVIMRLVDGSLSIPVILLALVLVSVREPSAWNVILVLSLVIWARFARLVRGEVLSLRERAFVALAQVAGSSSARIIARHIFPNILNTVIVVGTLQVGWVVLLEASLSFLGVGVPPPIPAWGSMVADGRAHMLSAWWLSLFPGIAILLLVLSLNFLGDWIRDRLDPRLRQV